MSFEKEISKLNEGNRTTAIDIKSENVFHDIIHLVLVFFFKDINNNGLNGLNFELLTTLEIGWADWLQFAP